MKTEYQIASGIMNYVTAARAVTNSDLDMDQVRDEMDTLRIRMLLELDQRGLLRKPFFSFTQFHTLTTKRDNDRKVIYVDLPRILVTRDNKPCIAYVGGTFEDSPYRIVTGNQLAWVNKTENWLRNAKTVHYADGRLTFRNDAPEKIAVRAVFMKPIEMAPFGYLWKKDYYPVPGDMADQMIGKMGESYLRTMYRIPVQPNTQTDNVSVGKK
jgi:hypothetical protein